MGLSSSCTGKPNNSFFSFSVKRNKNGSKVVPFLPQNKEDVIKLKVDRETNIETTLLDDDQTEIESLSCIVDENEKEAINKAEIATLSSNNAYAGITPVKFSSPELCVGWEVII